LKLLKITEFCSGFLLHPSPGVEASKYVRMMLSTIKKFAAWIQPHLKSTNYRKDMWRLVGRWAWMVQDVTGWEPTRWPVLFSSSPHSTHERTQHAHNARIHATHSHTTCTHAHTHTHLHSHGCCLDHVACISADRERVFLWV
jgi:hypothetical protein